MNADISASLGLIVTELVINALKHAFPGERGGAIIVDFHAMGKSWKLSAGDDGVGTTAKLADAKPGLGTSIVAALADQLNVTVTTENGEPGTKVSIVHDEPTGRCHNDRGLWPRLLKTVRQEASGDGVAFITLERTASSRQLQTHVIAPALPPLETLVFVTRGPIGQQDVAPSIVQKREDGASLGSTM